MLSLTRRQGQTLFIGSAYTFKINYFDKYHANVSITAPARVKISDAIVHLKNATANGHEVSFEMNYGKRIKMGPVTVSLQQPQGAQVKVGVDAPRHMKIERSEVIEKHNLIKHHSKLVNNNVAVKKMPRKANSRPILSLSGYK